MVLGIDFVLCADHSHCTCIRRPLLAEFTACCKVTAVFRSPPSLLTDLADGATTPPSQDPITIQSSYVYVPGGSEDTDACGQRLELLQQRFDSQASELQRVRSKQLPRL